MAVLKVAVTLIYTVSLHEITIIVQFLRSNFYMNLSLSLYVFMRSKN